MINDQRRKLKRYGMSLHNAKLGVHLCYVQRHGGNFKCIICTGAGAVKIYREMNKSA